MKTVLTIAGSDPTGGAGIAADLRTFAAMGVHGLTAVTAVTAQDGSGVRDRGQVTSNSLRAQLASIDSVARPASIKLGLLPNVEAVTVAARYLDSHPDVPAVLDPVLIASSGGDLTAPGVSQELAEQLLSRCVLVTPNHPELESLLARPVGSSIEELEAAAGELRARGARWLLLKGGHREGEDVVDLLVGDSGSEVFRGPRIGGLPARGTGCTLSAAIAAGLARGDELAVAARNAKAFLTAALESSYFVGNSRMRVLHAFWEYYGSEGLP